MARERLVVITPTFNERDNLAAFIDGIGRAIPDAHVLVVDDASPDGTGEAADEIARVNPRVHCLHRPAKLGLGTAYVEGFLWALERDFDLVAEMDADLSHDPRDLPRLVEAIRGGASVALGSRNIPGGGVLGWGLGRHLLSKGGSWYARAILGAPVHDMTTGFKVYRRDALRAIDPATLRSNGYAFQIETTYRALIAGLPVVEVPIVFLDRRVGQSKMSRRIFMEAVVEVWRLRLGSFARNAG
ncbi:MAG: polyprenol monophosphomannose synthase [Polyangiaceae bacterium]|nr:polyprenol monophosphomannose synthase [Polyangiaceae bacterium]